MNLFSLPKHTPSRHTERDGSAWINWMIKSYGVLTPSNTFNRVCQVYFNHTTDRNLAFLSSPNHALFGWAGA